PVEPVGDLELEPPRGHKLHADADAEERTPLLANGALQARAHARHRLETALAIGEGTDARKYDAVGNGDDFRIGSDHDLGGRAASRAARAPHSRSCPPRTRIGSAR